MDGIIRQRAVREGRSLNAAVLDVPQQGAGMGSEPVRYDDLDDLAGTWVEDPEFDRALAEMDTVDKDLWK